jgi:antitoxin (DNA-binding transcriptional repressor) of toxin-antitoxin stability system
MSETVGKREFLLHTSKYLHWVEETKEELVVTHRNKPVLRVVPSEPKTASSLRGFLRSIEVEGDINAPVLPPLDQW